MRSARAAIGARAVDAVVDLGVLPDPVLRGVIRLLLWLRLRSIRRGGVEAQAERKRALIASLRTSPVAIDTSQANEQHYEVPTELFELMLGPHLKYSSAWFPIGVTDLRHAEESMLRLTCERAELADGQDILELGCGWGSLTLWMAEHYPRASITAVSNSATQRAHIERQARARQLTNVTVLTCDVNRLGVDAFTDIVVPGAFDRVVSIEMFEHVRNHATLTERISSWLRPDGKLFVHVFAHRSDAYAFEVGSATDWMARHFFTGGLMPSDDLLLQTVRGLRVEDHWVVSGTHYARTLHAWLDRLDRHRDRILARFAEDHGARGARAQLRRWRVFTIACEELFAFGRGNEWHVSHYRFVRPAAPSSERALPAGSSVP
jgi:cyclopropane-fatty-acyl-phospholipid synthase